MFVFWLLYSISAAVGLLLAPGLHHAILGDYPDSSMMGLLLLGIAVTTIIVYFVFEHTLMRKGKLIKLWAVALGVFAWAPGVIVALIL